MYITSKPHMFFTFVGDVCFSVILNNYISLTCVCSMHIDLYVFVVLLSRCLFFQQ